MVVLEENLRANKGQSACRGRYPSPINQLSLLLLATPILLALLWEYWLLSVASVWVPPNRLDVTKMRCIADTIVLVASHPRDIAELDGVSMFGDNLHTVTPCLSPLMS